MSTKLKNVNKILSLNCKLYMCGFIIYSTTSMTCASETQIQNKGVEFDSSFLIGDSDNINIDRFKFGNPILAGEYNLDTYINGGWLGKRRYQFKNQDNLSSTATTCFSAKQLSEFGIKTEIIKNQQQRLNTPDDCIAIENWVEGAHYVFNIENLRIDISVPQVAMQQNARGYVDPDAWDRGIDAAFISYNAGANKSINRQDNRHEINSAFSSVNAGINIAGWQLRHAAQWHWQDDANSKGGAESSYEVINTYAQRAFPKIRSVVTLGENNTNGEIFDSFSYRGFDITSDEKMLPSSQVGYAPQIKGFAKTNAKVEVRQNAQLIYQTTVAAGNFEINDLYPTGFGGELNVSIIEANGEIQTLRIPYASVAQLLRPGAQRFSATIGQFNETNIDLSPWIAQAKYHRGLNNTITAFGGIQAGQDYTALNIGSALSTVIGAISMDVTHSRADFKSRNVTGESYRLSYSKLFAPTSTNITLAAYRYSTEHFYRLRDAVYIQDVERKGLSSNGVGQQKSEFQISLNQSLKGNWGNIYAVGSWADYWNLNEKTNNYQLGYSNNLKNINYGLSVNRREIQNNWSNSSRNDTEYLLSLNFPLTFKKSTVNINSNFSENAMNIGLNGQLGDRFSYGASVANQYNNQSNINLNSQYRSNYATLGATYSHSDNYQQYGVSTQGNILVHSKGLVLGPEQGGTMVLVYAPDAAGARVNSTAGLSINKSGYALIPYVTPYQFNTIQLNPLNMSYDVELVENSQSIAPYEGAISRVNFLTKKGKAVYIQSTRAENKSIPFAAEIYNSQGENIGMVGQGGLVFFRSNQAVDSVTVKWGDKPDQKCKIDYDISNHIKDKTNTVIMIEGKCQ